MRTNPLSSVATALVLTLMAASSARAMTTELAFTCASTHSVSEMDPYSSMPGATGYDVTASTTYKQGEAKYGGARRDVDVSFIAEPANNLVHRRTPSPRFIPSCQSACG